MASINEILGRNIDSVKELKKAISDLQNSLIGVDTESEQFKTTSMQLAAAQEELAKVTRAGKEENVAATDSIVGMEKEYKNLYNTYKMLSDEQRNSSFGKEMASQLEALSTKLNETKQGVGNFKDNIGRYASSVTEAFNKMGVSAGALSGPLKTATTGAKGFNTALKSLAANPIVLIITALVAILGKAAAAIKDNEELTNRLKEAMAVFKPVLDAISNAFDFLAGLLVKTVEGLSKVAEKVLSIIPGMKQAVQSHKDLAKATNDLTKAQREASVENSKKQAEIERLREEASATDDVIEKKKLLEEAKALQNEVDQKNIELAQEELRIMQEYAEKTANSAEENEKLAAAQKKVNDAIATGERNMRQYNKQLDQVESKTRSTGSATKDYREEAKKLYESTVEWNKTEIVKVTEKYNTEKKLLERYHMDTTLLTKKYEQDVSKIRADEIKKELNYYQEQMALAQRVKKIQAENYEAENGHAAALVKQIAEYKRIVTSYFDNIYDVFYKAYDSVGRGLQTALEELWQNGIMTKATDFEHIIGRLEYQVKKFGDSVEGKQYQEALDAVKNLGEEGWAKLSFEIERVTSYLQTEYGITIDTTGELTAQEEKLKFVIKELNKELKETFGQESAQRIAKFIDEADLKLLKEAFSIDTNMVPTGDVPNYLHEGTRAFDEMLNFIRNGEYNILVEQKALYEKELADFSGTTEQKLEMMRAYYETLSELRDRDAAAEELDVRRRQQIWDAAAERNNAIKQTISSVVDTISTYMQAEINSGKLTEQEAKKKEKSLKNLQKIQLAVAVSSIAAQTAGSIIDVWRGYAAELPVNAQTAAATGPAAAATKIALDSKSLASAILRTGAIGMEGTAQLAAAIGGYISKSSASSMSAGSDTSVGVTPVLIDSTPYSYTRTVQTEEDVDKLNQQPIWVSVTDIESGLGHHAQVVGESSF